MPWNQPTNQLTNQSFIFFVKFIDHLVLKKYKHHIVPSSSSKGLYSWKWKPNYLIALHFENTLSEVCNLSRETDVAG